MGVLARVLDRLGLQLKSVNSPHRNIPSHWPINWWQRGMSPPSATWDAFGPTRACVTVISQELSKIPAWHVAEQTDGSTERITTSAASRVLKTPNAFQTRSDFFLNATRELLTDGNAYALATFNRRQEVETLWPVSSRAVAPYLSDDGQVFYRIASDPWTQMAAFDPSQMYPARAVLHVRLDTPVHPLIGESPLKALELTNQAGMAIQQNSATFFSNNSQPDGVLRVPGNLDEDSAKAIQDRWMSAHAGSGVGKVAVLGAGAEYQPVTMTATDAELVSQYRLTVEEAGRVFRVPPFLLGNLENATLTNVEALTRFFVNSCLGWYVDHWEQALGRFFRLSPNERIDFDIESVLLRTDLVSRMDGYSKGVQAGIYAPNEARRRERLPRVPYGDEPRVQQQMVPLSFGAGRQPGAASQPPDEQQLEAAANVVRLQVGKYT